MKQYKVDNIANFVYYGKTFYCHGYRGISSNVYDSGYDAYWVLTNVRLPHDSILTVGGLHSTYGGSVFLVLFCTSIGLMTSQSYVIGKANNH